MHSLHRTAPDRTALGVPTRAERWKVTYNCWKRQSNFTRFSVRCDQATVLPHTRSPCALPPTKLSALHYAAVLTPALKPRQSEKKRPFSCSPQSAGFAIRNENPYCYVKYGLYLLYIRLQLLSSMSAAVRSTTPCTRGPRRQELLFSSRCGLGSLCNLLQVVLFQANICPPAPLPAVDAPHAAFLFGRWGSGMKLGCQNGASTLLCIITIKYYQHKQPSF